MGVLSRSSWKRRKVRWIRPDVQSRMIYTMAAFSVLIVALNTSLCLLGVWTLQSGATPAESAALVAVSEVIFNECVVLLPLGIVLAIFLGIYQSFKFSGPIFRISRYLVELRQGRWARECHLRQGDLLQDIRDHLNAAIGSITGFARKQHEALRQVRALLEASGAPMDDALAERLDRLEVEYRHHLGGGDEAPDSATAPRPAEALHETAG